MIVRSINSDEYEKYLRVSSLAFSWKLDMSKEEGISPESEYLCAFDDDNETLMAQLEYARREFYFCGKRLSCIAIGGVASAPEHRRKGAVRALFEKIEQSVSVQAGFLYPFSNDYYRQFGYERVSRTLDVTVPFSFFSRFERNCSAFLYKGGEREKKELVELYNKCAAKFNLIFVREKASAFSEKPHETQKLVYIHRDGEMCDAYACFSVERELGELAVSEIGFLSRGALAAMLGFLRHFDGQVGKVHFLKLSENSPVLNLITEYNKCAITLKSDVAAHLYDVETVLRANTYPLHDGAFRLKCNDGRNGETVFEVKYGRGEASVERVGGEYDIALNDAATARLLLAGEGLCAADCEYLNGIELKNGAEGFFFAFPKRNVLLCDGF